MQCVFIVQQWSAVEENAVNTDGKLQHLPRRRRFSWPDGPNRWEFWVRASVGICTPFCDWARLVSAGGKCFNKITWRSRTHKCSCTLYLASNVAVAGCLTLRTPQQGLTPAWREEKIFVTTYRSSTEIVRREMCHWRSSKHRICCIKIKKKKLQGPVVRK